MHNYKKLGVFLPTLLFSILSLSGCKKEEIKVLRVFNSEDYIYECEEEEYYCDECGDYVDNHKAVHEVDGEEHTLIRDKLTGWFCPICNERIDYEDVTCTGFCKHSVYKNDDNEWFCDTCEDVIEGSEVFAEDGLNKHKLHEEHEVYLDMDMIDQFAADWYDRTGEKVSVIYDTYDTNETMYNSLNTGKTSYDVIITSDYMVQKCITSGMLRKLDNYEETTVDGIWSTISNELTSRFENIYADEKNENGETTSVAISEYSVPYMWGTVGVMYNPEYYMEKRGIDTSDPESEEYQRELNSIIEDFKSWDTLYDTSSSKKYSKSFSIKDSVRDTYAVSLIHAFKDEIASIETNYADQIKKAGDDAVNSAVDEGITDQEELTAIRESSEENEINSILYKIFNQSDEETIAIVKEDMLKLKENAFGFETDSGKTDMVDQKVGANMCWSGDATWAIWVAEDPSLEESDDGKERESVNIYYSTPTGKNGEEASNIWVDSFCLMDNGDSPEALAQYELAQAFVEYMCDEESAVANGDCVGYTSGVAGDAILDYYYDAYDVRGVVGEEDPEGEEYVEYDLRYFFDGALEEYELDDAILHAYPEYINRQLSAQFPLKENLVRLATMNNFPEQDTINLLNMWEQVRTNKLPVWGTVVFIVEIGAIISLGAYFIIKNRTRKHLKKER